MSQYTVTSIIRWGTREQRVQDIVSANGDIGIARPLASTKPVKEVRPQGLIFFCFRGLYSMRVLKVININRVLKSRLIPAKHSTGNTRVCSLLL